MYSENAEQYSQSNPLPCSELLCDMLVPMHYLRQISEIIDKGTSSCVTNGALYTIILFVIGCPILDSCFYRSKLRQQYLLKESPCVDYLVHCCCESCALCQEYRELKNRGFDTHGATQFL